MPGGAIWFNPGEALFHPTTSGMQHTVVRLTESKDGGRTWAQPWNLDYTLPDLIAPGQFLLLSDGSLGMPFEVWHEWEKGWSEGPSTRLISSHDGGKTWPDAGIIARDETRRQIYGDPRLARLPDGRLVVLLWVHNIETENDLPIHRSESSDDGRTWSAPISTGLTGQIANPIAIRDALMVGVYQKRFGADAGLRSVLSYDAGVTWDDTSDKPLSGFGVGTDKKNPFSGYEEYSFGYSTVFGISDEEFLVPFWISNGKTTYVRVLKVKVI
jgi:hypothetical protein